MVRLMALKQLPGFEAPTDFLRTFSADCILGYLRLAINLRSL
jgi:hypothetical protein